MNKRLLPTLLLLTTLAGAQSNSLIYGNAWQANALANIRVGLDAVAVDYRWLAEQSSTVPDTDFFFKSGGGYGTGTGGTMHISFQTDDGSASHNPSGTELAFYSFVPGNTSRAWIQDATWSTAPATSSGTFYHYVFTNTDASPTLNNISVDDLDNVNLTAAPYYAGGAQLNCSTTTCFQALAELWEASGPPWAIKTNHIPVFSTNYANGVHQGQGYTDALAGSQLFSVEGANLAGQLFNPSTPLTVGGVNIWAQKVGSPSGPLTVALQTAAGGAIDSATIPASAVGTSFTWNRAAFSAPHTLAASSSYRVTISAPTDVSNYYQVFPMQTGASIGMPAVGSLFSTGNYQTNTGSGWTTIRSDYAMGMFFSTANVYVAQTAQGGNTGADCADAFAVTFFNTSGNWGSGAGQIGPGTVVHLCGTITTELSAKGSGSSGNPITIVFETGAAVQISPGADSNGAVGLGGNSYITIDGGASQPCGWNTATNVSEGACNGTVENMLYGSPGATCPGGACTTQPSSTGCPGDALIEGSGSNIEIRNLNVGPSYIHTSTSNDSHGTPGICKNSGATNWNVHDNKLHDGGWFLQIVGGSGITIANNELYNNGHMVAVDGSSNLNGLVMSGDYCHDMNNWDTASDAWHNNCIHMFTNAPGQSMTNVTIDNNIMTGHMGQTATGQIFVETNGGSATNFAIFNNVLGNLDTSSTAAERLLDLSNANGSFWVYNNTGVGPNNNWGWCSMIGYSGGPAVSLTADENNAFGTCGYLNESDSVTYGALDYNAYGPFGQGWKWNGTTINSFTTWKSSSGEGTHSTYTSGGLNLNSSYQPNTGSPLIGAGVNVCTANPSFCTTYPAIKNDIAGNPRAASGAWDVGAYAANVIYTITSQEPVTKVFYPGSIFANTPLPANTSSNLAPNSDSIVEGVFGGSPANAALTVISPLQRAGAQKSAKYYTSASDPIYYIGTVANPPTGTNAHSAQGHYFHLKSGAIFPGTTADSIACFWDQSTDIDPQQRNLCFYQFNSGPFSLPACTATTQAQALANCNLSVNAASYDYPFVDTMAYATGNTYASAGYAPMAALLRSQELIQGQINHPLLGEYSCAPTGYVTNNYVFPAFQASLLCSPPSAAPGLVNGMLLFIDSSYNCSALTLPPQVTVCKALQNYGIYLHDTGGTNPEGIYILQEEQGSAYTYASTTDPVYSFLNGFTTGACPSPNASFNCGPNGLMVENDLNQVDIPWLNMPGLLTGSSTHLHIANTCIAQGLAGVTGGCVPAPTATITPSSLAFGAQTTGTTSAPQVLTLENTGLATLNIVSIVKSGTNPGSYGLTTTCGATLAVLASCTASVTFSPATVASLPASITFTTNDPVNPTQVIPLTGSGVAPVIGKCLTFQGGVLIQGGLRLQCP